MQQQEDLQQRTPGETLRARIGVYIQASDTVEAIVRIQEAEHAGVQQAWMAMGGTGFADSLTALALAAERTERIKLGTAILPASPRHPLVTAQQALAIHDIAPGRLRLVQYPQNGPEIIVRRLASPLFSVYSYPQIGLLNMH